MASSDYDFQSTRNEIITQAYRKCGAIGADASPDAGRLAEGVRALNQLVKSWQALHVFLWTEKYIQVELTASTATYSLSTDPTVLAVEQAFRRDENDEDTKIQLIPWREYQEILDKGEEGEPIKVTIDYQREPTLYVYRVPSTAYENYKIQLFAITKLKDFDSASGTGDFPVRFEKAMVYGLAADLSDSELVPLKEREWLAEKAEREFFRAKASDYERVEEEYCSGAFDG